MSFVFDGILAALLLAIWYLGWREFNRRQAEAIITRIQEAVGGQVCVSAPRWQSASRFRLQLRFPAAFRESSLAVALMPREMPLNWLLARLRREKQCILFEAEFEHAPAAHLVIANHRWIGRTNRKGPSPECCFNLGSLVVTTREDWQSSTALIEALFATKCNELVQVEFRKKPPHLLLSAPLELLNPETEDSSLFHLLQELASCASAKRL